MALCLSEAPASLSSWLLGTAIFRNNCLLGMQPYAHIPVLQAPMEREEKSSHTQSQMKPTYMIYFVVCLCVCMCVEAKRRIGSSGAGVTGCKPQTWVLGTEPDPLEKQQMLVTSEPPFTL